MDLRAAARQYAGMLALQWSQLAVADLQGATPVFRNRSALLPALRLEPGAVHLWLAELDPPAGGVADCEKLLTAAERDRATKFRFPVDRRRFIVRRAVLRELVASYVARPAPTIEFATNPFGKPLLTTPCACGNLQFNLSVSQDVALYGFVWNAAIGVDLAHHRAEFDWTEIMNGFFHPNESAHIRRLPPAEQARAFYKLWALKEALVKARGGGLSDPLAKADFTSLLQNTARPLTDAAGRHWNWTGWELNNSATATLAVER